MALILTVLDDIKKAKEKEIKIHLLETDKEIFIRRKDCFEELQTFKNEEGIIICIKCGWIAVDIPAEINITDAEYRGTSTRYIEGTPFSYYDIALNGKCILHVLRHSYGTISGCDIQPFFFDEYPF